MSTNNSSFRLPPNFRPTTLELYPQPAESYTDAVCEHQRRLMKAPSDQVRKEVKGIINKYNSIQEALAARPPTPSGNYRPISFGLPRHTLPAETSVDDETALQTRRVRFVDPENTCALCASFLIRPCGAKDADEMTLVGSDDDDDEDEDDDDGENLHVVYRAVAAAYPPDPTMENFDEICDLTADFNVTVGSMVAQQVQGDYLASILKAGRSETSGFTLVPARGES